MAFPYSSALQTSLARAQGFSLMVATHNSTALEANGITEDIFIFLVFLGQKIFYIQLSDTKSPCLMPTIFLSLVFHPREHNNPNILMGAKQWVRDLL